MENQGDKGKSTKAVILSSSLKIRFTPGMNAGVLSLGIEILPEKITGLGAG